MHNSKTGMEKYAKWTLEGSNPSVLGLLFTDKECKELEYMLRKELDEMLFDLRDQRIDDTVRAAIASRYKIIFRMYARLASPKELSRYALKKGYPSRGQA